VVVLGAGGAPFASLLGDASPRAFVETLRRAARLSAPDRVIAVVSRAGGSSSRGLPVISADNLLVEPYDRGTAASVLLAMMHVLEIDPGGTLVVLPRPVGPEHGADFDAEVARAVARAGGPDGQVSLVGAGTGDVAAVVARLDQLMRLYERSLPSMLAIFLHELVKRHHWQPWQVARMYQLVLTRDFGSDLVAGAGRTPADFSVATSEPGLEASLG